MGSTKSSFLEKVLGRLNRLDAQDLQQVVQRLARERDLLETLFNTIEDGVLVVDAEGRVAYVNQAVTRLLGLSPEGAEGQPIDRALPEVDWAKVLATRGAREAEVVRHELVVTYPQRRFLRLLVAPLGGEGARNGGVVLILHDTTEARKQTAEAIESERLQALTLLAASVAHEVGNPLNALHIHLQLIEREVRKLRRGEDAPVVGVRARRGRRGPQVASGAPVEAGAVAAKIEKYLGVAKGEITRLDYIVTQFLQAIRPAQPQIRPSSVNEVVRRTLDLLRPELENRGLAVEERLSRHVPEAAFDPSQITQALVNLIKNSMQAMTKGGTLTLATGGLGGDVWVSVGDTGAGIGREQLTRLFEPYYTTKEKGTGLGLMIVYRIVREHGGRIDVESHPGRGTVFRLWLPRSDSGPRLLPGAGAAVSGS
jgi:PAS domain S-box-containing protein